MIFHALTAALVLLKVMGHIDVSWWLVVAPSLALLVLGMGGFLVALFVAGKLAR